MGAMPLMMSGLEALATPRRVLVLAVGGPEALMASTPLALALEAAGHDVRLGCDAAAGPGEPEWAAYVNEWYAEQARETRVVEDHTGFDLTFACGGASVLDAIPRDAHFVAVTALGAEAAFGVDPALAEARIAAIAAHGGLLHVEAIARFELAGRHFVELVEHVHHRAGPEHQSVLTDSLRAALFGRAGDVPVSLATRERPPRLSPATTLVWFLDPDEARAQAAQKTP